jgi:hypothetical protein
VAPVRGLLLTCSFTACSSMLPSGSTDTASFIDKVEKQVNPLGPKSAGSVLLR